MLRKGVHPYEYINDWEKFNETTLPQKEDFDSHLNTEDITDADYNSFATKGVINDPQDSNYDFQSFSYFLNVIFPRCLKVCENETKEIWLVHFDDKHKIWEKKVQVEKKMASRSKPLSLEHAIKFVTASDDERKVLRTDNQEKNLNILQKMW